MKKRYTKRYVLCKQPPSASGMPKIFEYEFTPVGVDICPACGRSVYGLHHATDNNVNMLIIMRRNLNRREGVRK